MAKTAEMVITNTYAGGDYTGRLQIGEPPVDVNLLLDTGSSTLAVKPGFYSPDKDTAKEVINIAQRVTYGTGAWEGPVFKTKVTFPGEKSAGAALKTYLAVAYPSGNRTNNFASAGGILGLAYKPLNNADSFTDTAGKPIPTWPFKPALLNAGNHKQVFFAPYFTQLEQNGIVANKFAFYTLRSSIKLNPQGESNDPCNQGLFIWGGGEDRTDLHTGEFQSVALVHDQFYNTSLISAQVGNGAAHVVAGPDPRTLSNSILDSGTSSLALTPKLYEAVLAGFSQKQRDLLRKYAPPRPGYYTVVPTSELDLNNWPRLAFTFLAADNQGQVTLTVSPETYWQTDSGFSGGQSQSYFHIDNTGEDGQSILGLPLMNNYFTIFDRSAPGFGEIKFAPIKPPAL